MNSGPGTGRTLLPKDFYASGVNSGVRRYRPDLGIITTDTPAVAAGVFTRNECKAAPILYCQKLLPASGFMAVVTNSGQANAATGKEGMRRNQLMVEKVAEVLECKPNQVLAASTGVIGAQIEIEKIQAATKEMIDRTNETAEGFALAILTTDLVPKAVTTTIKLSTGEARITGICKGSGMIHPNMGTMLGYLLTDVELTPRMAHDLLVQATDLSFNMISVDGDTSTNDCVFLLANGASGASLKDDSDLKIFREALIEISIFLAKSIARDGEGASKLIEVSLKNSDNESIARKAARGITLSPLIKSAVHGEDPNWGRILARLGAEGVSADSLERMQLKLQGVTVFENGAPIEFDRQEVRRLLKRETVNVDVDLRSGSNSVMAWGCDLSKKYVEINTEYTT